MPVRCAVREAVRGWGVGVSARQHIAVPVFVFPGDVRGERVGVVVEHVLDARGDDAGGEAEEEVHSTRSGYGRPPVSCGRLWIQMKLFFLQGMVNVF